MERETALNLTLGNLCTPKVGALLYIIFSIMHKEKITQQASVDFWLDLQASIKNMLQAGTPEQHLEILQIMFDAYIQSDFANLPDERREVHVEFGIFKNILKTLQKHAITGPYSLLELPA